MQVGAQMTVVLCLATLFFLGFHIAGAHRRGKAMQAQIDKQHELLTIQAETNTVLQAQIVATHQAVVAIRQRQDQHAQILTNLLREIEQWKRVY